MIYSDISKPSTPTYSGIAKPATPTYSSIGTPSSGGFLTQENSYYILLENGSKIILSPAIYTNISKPV